MKRMRDYSKWPLWKLMRQAEHHRAVIVRLRTGGYPHGANRLLLEEIERQIEVKSA